MGATKQRAEWSDEEKQRLRALILAGHDSVSAGRKLGRSSSSARHQALKLGLLLGKIKPKSRALVSAYADID